MTENTKIKMRHVRNCRFFSLLFQLENTSLVRKPLKRQPWFVMMWFAKAFPSLCWMHLHHIISFLEAALLILCSSLFISKLSSELSHLDYVHFLTVKDLKGEEISSFFVVSTLWSLLRARGTWTTRMSSHKRVKKISGFQFLWYVFCCYVFIY